MWIDDIVNALQRLGGVGRLDDIYAEIASSRVDLSRTWQDTVRRTIQQYSSDTESYLEKEDIFYSVAGIGNGVWGLRDSSQSTVVRTGTSVNNPPERVQTTIIRIVRDTRKSMELKALYANRCQICRQAFDLGDGRTYSEAHHIVPLGAPHAGLDEWANMLVLCPNHHARCDYGGIRLSKNDLHIIDCHHISDDFLSYHNSVIASGSKSSN